MNKDKLFVFNEFFAFFFLFSVLQIHMFVYLEDS